MRKKITKGHVVIVIVLILLALICLYPMWYTLIVSFSGKAYVDGGRVWMIPMGFNLKSYGKILEDKIFFSAIGVSVERVIVGCALNMFLLIITAFPLCLPGKKFPEGKFPSTKWKYRADAGQSEQDNDLFRRATCQREAHLNSAVSLRVP